MFRQNPPGFHTSLTPELKQKLLDAVPEVIIQNQCAAYVGMWSETLTKWMKRGKQDLLDENCTVFSQLYLEFRAKQAEVVRSCLKKMKKGKDYDKSLRWILERCFKSDFGTDAGEYKELLDQYVKLRAEFDQLSITKGKSHAKGKMDTESD